MIDVRFESQYDPERRTLAMTATTGFGPNERYTAIVDDVDRAQVVEHLRAFYKMYYPEEAA